MKFLWLLLWASLAHGQLIIESAGTHWFKNGRVRTGPTHFSNLGNPNDTVNAGDGTRVYCQDCQQTCPALGGGSGADCVHEAGTWDCCHGGGGGGGICTPASSVPQLQRALSTVATSGTCADNWLPYCDVRNYGAKGDGVTDDSISIVNAINACCSGGTAIAPVFFPATTASYLVSQGFNTNEACFNLRLIGGDGGGNGATLVKLNTQLNGCTTIGSGKSCTPLFDLDGGEIENMILKGPGSTFTGVPTGDSANTDGVWNANRATNVWVQQFTTGFNFAVLLDKVNLIYDYIGAEKPQYVRDSVFQNFGFAAVHIGHEQLVDIRSEQNGYANAPYLWFAEPDTNTQPFGIVSEKDTFGQFGNAGISMAVSAQGSIHILHGNVHSSVLSPFVQGEGIGPQTNSWKLPTVAVDGALHFGALWGRNVIERNLHYTTGCTIDNIHGTLKWIDQSTRDGRDPDTFPSDPLPKCTVTLGSSSRVTLCNENETQCVPQTITQLTAVSNPTINEESNTYFVNSPINSLQTLTATGPSCADMAGQKVTLIFTGNTTVVNGAGGCDLLLNGGVNFSAATGNTLTLVNDGTHWREMARSPTPSGSSTSAIQSMSTTLTSPQILALNTTPIILVPAPGASSWIWILFAESSYHFNTTAYVNANNQVQLQYAGGSVLPWQFDALVLNDTSSNVRSYPVGTGMVSLSSPPTFHNADVANRAVQLGATSNPTTGDGTLTMTIVYEILPTP